MQASVFAFVVRPGLAHLARCLSGSGCAILACMTSRAPVANRLVVPTRFCLKISPGLAGSLFSIALMISAFLPVIAAAQGADSSGEDPWAGIEEMLVIGSGGGALGLLSEKGSVMAFGAEDLAAYGIENTADLADFTPNLEIVQTTATTATFFIRGVGLQDFSANAAGAVAVYSDGVPLNSPPIQVAPIFDAEAVDVLRGPQGSGDYRNASAGVIAIQSRRPSFDGYAVNFKTTQGSYYSADAVDAQIQNYEGGLNVPVIPDILATRFAFAVTEKGGLFTNRCAFRPDAPGLDVCGESGSPVSPLLPNDLQKQAGSKSVFSLRSSWLLKPPVDLDLDFQGTFYFSRRDQDGNFGQATGTGNVGGIRLGSATAPGGAGIPSYSEPDGVAEIQEIIGRGYTPIEATRVFEKNFARQRPLDRRPFDGDYNRRGKQRVEIMGGTLKSSLSLDYVDINATTGVVRFETKSDSDSDFVPITLFEIEAENQGTQVSQDLVFSGELDAMPLSWEIGGFFLWEDLESKSLTDLAASDNERNFSQDTFSYAFFAGMQVDLLDDFTLSGGIRYNTEYKQFSITQDLINPLFPQTASADDELTWRELTGTVELVYRFSESTTAYAKYNHGWKPGHFNSNGLQSTPSTGTTVRDPARPERIDSFEVGFNGSYWEDRASLRSALFHYNYEDLQVFVFEDQLNGPPSLQVINANDARVFGAEVELKVRPLEGFVPESIEGLEASINFGWLDSKFLDFQNRSLIPTGSGPIEITSDYTGNTLLNSPEFTVSGSLMWPFGIGRLGVLTPRYDFSWTDQIYFDPSEGAGTIRVGNQLPEGTLGQNALLLHNVRLTYTPAQQGIELTGWCRNVTDERFKTYAFDVSRFRSVVINFPGEPRSCGADISFNW